MVRDVLRDHGFRVSSLPYELRLSTSEGSLTEVREVQIAERNLRRGPTNPPALHAVLALVGAGLVLGILETYLAGSVVYALPWVVATLAFSLVLWLRYGRTFESDVIVATARDTSEASDRSLAAAGPVVSPEVFLEAGRVQSALHGGKRIAVRLLDCPPAHIRELVSVVHRFEALVKDSSTGSASAPSLLPG